MPNWHLQLDSSEVKLLLPPRPVSVTVLINSVNATSILPFAQTKTHHVMLDTSFLTPPFFFKSIGLCSLDFMFELKFFQLD